MKTDVITVSSSGRQIEAALQQVDKVAVYKGLSHKGALHLRLLTEEMMGMMRSITGETEGQFWVEDDGQVYQLHLLVDTNMTLNKRERLISASTSGKNEASRGLMGRLRSFFDQSASAPVMPLMHPDMMHDTTTTYLEWEWRMTTYQNELKNWVNQDEKAREMWDELEQSVVTHVADEIKVSIRGQQAELIILKKLA